MKDMVFPVAWVIGVLALVVVVYLHQRRARKAEAEENERRKIAIEEGIRKKILLPNGKPACIVCGREVATESWPVVKRSWLDRVTVLKDLYALTPRYSVVDGDGEEYQLLLCRHDKRMGVQKWNEFLSSKRTQVQAVLSQVETELSYMEGGGMLLYLQAQHERSMEKLAEFVGAPAPVRPALRSFNDSADHGDPISLPPMTTESGKDKPEDTN